MSTVMFDKLTFVQKLREAAVPQSQAEAFAHALDTAFREEVATKSELERQLAPMKTDIALLKWGILTLHGIAIAASLKLFLP